MTQVASIEEIVEIKPQDKHLSDYRVSNFSVSTIDLEFDLYDSKTQVKATSLVTRTDDENKPLFLFGEHLKLLSLLVDDVIYDDFQLVEGGL